MAERIIESPLAFPNFSVDSEDQARTFSAARDGEIDVGAFRGLAFALLIQTVLTILGCLGWEIWRSVAR